MNNHRAAGFTLIETLVYLALFSVIMGGVMVGAYHVIEASDRTQGSVVVQEEGNFVLHKVVWALTGAASITLPVANSTGTTLSVQSASTSQNPLVFTLASSVLRLSRAGGVPVSLTSSNVAAAVQFRHVVTTSKPDALTVSLTLNGRLFQTTTYLR